MMQCGGCLCACSQLAASQLVSRLPTLLHREHAEASGWHVYLSTIYGADVHYPVDLTQLRMLYYRTSIWQLNASSSPWPLLPCHARTGFGVVPDAHAAFGPSHEHLVDAASINCTVESSASSSLLTADDNSLATGDNLRLETYHAFEVRTNQIGLVAAIRWWWSASAPTTAAHASPLYSGAPDYSWVEVTRWACPVEGGRPRFGTWFAAAAGSGIFLNVGRSYRIAAKGKFLPERTENGSHQYLQLVDAWRASRGVGMETARRIVYDWAHNGSLQVWGDAFALMAFDLGFDTVQVGTGSDGAGAGVPSPQIVHLSPPDHGPGPADRPPRFVSGRPRMGACGIGIALRRGWRHQHVCHCDPTKALLNVCSRNPTDEPFRKAMALARSSTHFLQARLVPVRQCDAR